MSRVFLHGEGPDHGLLYEWRPYITHLLAEGQYGRVLRDVFVTATRVRRAAYSKTATARLGENDGLALQLRPREFPDWVNPKLESQYSLRERWEAKWLRPPSGALHPIRPVAYAAFQGPVWQAMFDEHDAGSTGAQVEVRHPYVDLRMLRFLLAIPPLPWCKQKYLMRRAMRGVLPESVLARAKETVPWATTVARVSGASGPPLDPVPELSAYVDIRRFPKEAPQDQWLLGCALRARSLNNWLQYLQQKPSLRKA